MIAVCTGAHRHTPHRRAGECVSLKVAFRPMPVADMQADLYAKADNRLTSRAQGAALLESSKRLLRPFRRALRSERPRWITNCWRR